MNERGRPWRRAFLAVAVVVVGMSGCAPLAVDGQNLDGTRWVSVSIAGRAPIAGWVPTIIFEATSVHGSSGCNTYATQGPISISNGTVALGQILMTLGACLGPDGQDLPVMALEQTFWRALSSADHIAIGNGQLVLSGPAGALIFERQR